MKAPNTSGKTVEKIILGIDPGTNVMGYGLLKIDRNFHLIAAGVIKVPPRVSHQEKLEKILYAVEKLILQYKPDELAIEAPFYGKNIQSMLKLGRAQGAAISVAIQHKIPVFEYAPKKIKQSITGNGNASKEQVAAMLKSLLKFRETPQYLDATDGLATALCHHFQSGKQNMNGSSSKSKSWEEFIKNNPERLR